MTLSLKVPLLTVICVLATALVSGAVTYAIASNAAITQAVELNGRSVRFYADAIHVYVEGARATLETEAAGISRESNVIAAGVEAARVIRAHAPTFDHLFVLRPDGRIVAIEPDSLSEGVVSPDLRHAEWFRDISRTRATQLSDLTISEATKRPTIIVATPLRDGGGRYRGVLAGALDLSALSRLGTTSLDPSRLEGGYVTDGNGLVIADQNRPAFVSYQTDLRSFFPVRAALRDGVGTGRWTGITDREPMVGAYVRSPEGWAVVFRTSERAALEPFRRLAAQIMIFGALIAFGMGAIAAAVVRRSMRPVTQLAAALQTRDDMSVRPRVPDSGGEVGLLVRRFNEAADALDARDAVVRKRTDMLESANAELESFAYSVAHDLRTPLRSMEGFAHALVEEYGPQLDDTGRAFCARIQAATRRMATLIDDMLMLSRITRANLHLRPVDLSALAESILTELAQREPERVVATHVTPGLIGRADPDLMHVLLENLLSNAWKFTSKTRDARIEFGADAGGRFFVKDNGAGFDMAYVQNLFRPFTRLHSQEEFEGTGVGLATVKRIVLRHGGSVSAVGEPGRGVTVTFSLHASSAEPVLHVPSVETEAAGSRDGQEVRQ